MEYTIQKLGHLAGISTRTLRYYDEIGLLKPARVNSSGYRIYGESQVDTLQQILFFRELGFDLETIKACICSPSFNRAKALAEHHDRLLDKRKQLDLLIVNVEKTIASMEGRVHMSDKEKFEGFKQKMVEENEAKYGEELRQKYDATVVNDANATFKNMTLDQYNHVTEIEKNMKETLAKAMENGDPRSELAQEAAELHKQWLSFYWPSYTKEAHAGLAHMYVEDERFKAYYDTDRPGTAEFLRDAILEYTGMKN